MAWGPSQGACSRWSRRASSIWRICSRDEPPAFHVATELSQGVGRDRLALGRAQSFEAFGGLLQLGIEAADAEPDQRGLHPVDDPALLSDEALALAVGPLGIFVLDSRDRHHLAVIALAAQPAEKGAFEQFGVEPVGLGAAVFARYGDARCVNDMGLDVARPEPARQPEAVPAGLEGDSDALDPCGPPCPLPLAIDGAASAMRSRRSRASSTAGARRQAQCRRRASSTGSSRSRRSACCPVRGGRGIGSGRSASAWERSIGSSQRRWIRSPRRPPHSIFPGGFRTPAPVHVVASVMGRHPKPFTEAAFPTELNTVAMGAFRQALMPLIRSRRKGPYSGDWLNRSGQISHKSCHSHWPGNPLGL